VCLVFLLRVHPDSSAGLVGGLGCCGLIWPLYRIVSVPPAGSSSVRVLVAWVVGSGGGGVVVWWWCGVGVRSCFENCIVNASIFDLLCSSFLGHTVDALVPGADEGRGSLRYAPGSWQPSVDPGVSEWGNLAPVMGCCLRLN
jgi:hypothetical protein